MIGMPVTDGVYDTFLFGAGAFGYAEGSPKVPAEVDRDSLSGVDVLISVAISCCIHAASNGPVSAISAGDATSGHPTRAELATGTNWTRVYDPKQIRIVCFKHKIA